MRKYGIVLGILVGLGGFGCGLSGTSHVAEIRTAVYAYGFFYLRMFDQIHGNDTDDLDTSTDYSALCTAVANETFALPSGCKIASGCDSGDDKKTVVINCTDPVDNGEGLPGLHDSTEVCGDREGLQAMAANRMTLSFDVDNITRLIKIEFDGDIWFFPDEIQKLWIDVDMQLKVAADDSVSVNCDYEDFKYELESGEGTMVMEPTDCELVKPTIENFINNGGQCPE